MSDNRKKAEEKMAKAIFISADCWLCVFDLLTPSQLGLGIALISNRFDYYVDEHFKMRKWTFALFQIGSKIGKNGTKEMEITNLNGKPMPIPQKPLPKKIIGFKRINIFYIDQNAITFLRHFRQLFADCPIHLTIITHNDRIAKFLLRNIWPIFEKNIHCLELSAGIFNRFRQFVPSILNDCPSLRFVCFTFDKLFAEFPCDDNAMASDGQAVAKWLFTPLQNNVPKMFKCWLQNDDPNLSSKVEALKAAFASASSPANFIIVFWFLRSNSVVPLIRQFLPVLMLNASKWQWPRNVRRMQRLLAKATTATNDDKTATETTTTTAPQQQSQDGAATTAATAQPSVINTDSRMMFTIKDIVHQSFSDFGFLVPGRVARYIGVQGDLDPLLTGTAVLEMVLQFLESQFLHQQQQKEDEEDTEDEEGEEDELEEEEKEEEGEKESNERGGGGQSDVRTEQGEQDEVARSNASALDRLRRLVAEKYAAFVVEGTDIPQVKLDEVAPLVEAEQQQAVSAEEERKVANDSGVDTPPTTETTTEEAAENNNQPSR
ncbi:hypothetical protein niasHS_008783 [Heterodera schachtii]|uniref:1-alkyl-2-acetylglycerophosphocholine esterase n=1 Tax=Heterodera schachtii TaxID=97005 RepID=A0ABD2J7L0_HETSC